MHKLLSPALLCFSLSLAASPLFAQVKSQVLDQNGLPKNIVFMDGVPAQDGQALLQQHLKLGASDRMVLQSVTRPKPGIVVERYQQWIQGLRVAHGSYVLTAKDGEAKYMSGRIFPAPPAGAEIPALTEQDALAIAMKQVNGKKFQWEDEGANETLRQLTKNPDTSFYPFGKLVWVEDFQNDAATGQLFLAWQFDIYATEPLKREEIFVNAKNGEILLVNPRLYHAAGTGSSLYSGTVPLNIKKHNATQYRLEDTVRGGGIITKSYNNGTFFSSVSEVTSNTNFFNSSAAVDAHWGASMVYDYWQTKHNRNSIDDNGFPLYSYVNYDNDFDNAFWNGSWMTYGDGSGILNGGFSPLTSLDVCAHEIGHGICSNTSDLIYHGESGAMNESLSDIWGATIEAFADPHETDAKAKDYWQIGEEIGSSPMRYLNNPKLQGQPNTYNGTYWIYAGPGCDNTFDNCGVHFNSGVGNYWYYLLVNGGSGTNDKGKQYAVSGIGMDQAADIVYLTALSLTSTSKYVDFHQASVNAAGVLFGDCSPQQFTVDSAWYAVGIGDGYLPCIPNITFNAPDTAISEWANSTACPAVHEVLIPIKFRGPAATGGSATASISVTGGTAVAGVDYALGASSFLFPEGSTATQYIPLNIFDNGAVSPDKTIKLNISIDPGASNVSPNPVVSAYTISIKNNDNRPDTGATVVKQVGTLDGTIGNKSSPFRSERAKARSQYLLTAAMLQQAGVIPGAPITSIAFSISTKNSTQPFTGYTVKIGHTNTSNLNNIGNWISGLTEVYTGNLTTVVGWNTISFNTGTFTWDGVSNVVVEVCFNNTTAGSDNDKVYAYQPGSYTPNVWAASNSFPDGCAASFNVSTGSPAMPILRFQQAKPPTQIAQTAGSMRAWTVRPAQENYFYSAADSQLIAGVRNPGDAIECLNATVVEAGNGFAPLAGDGSMHRSLKAFTLSSATPATATSYEATFYYKTEELVGEDAAGMKLLHTTATTDAEINTSNTEVITPVAIKSTSFTSFRGNFTGPGRFFLVTGSLNIPNTATGSQGLWVAGNPFHDKIVVRYSVQKDARAELQLMDITGRILYRSQTTLTASQQQLSIPVQQIGLAQGQYLLRITTPEGVTTFKLTKQ